MFKLRLLVASVMVFGLTLGMAGSALAKCGECHGTIVPNKDASGASRTFTDKRLPAPYGDSSAPVYENSKMPQPDNNGIRGLHGIHMNYSSATYGNMAASSLKDPNNSATVVIANVRGRGNCSYCHTGGTDDRNHESGFVSFTSSGPTAASAAQPLVTNKYLMVYTSAGRGVSYKGNISSMDKNPTGYCTTACHKGTSASNPAMWGNYTTASVKLTCNSCHGDASNDGGTASVIPGYSLSAVASKGHKEHLVGGWTVGGINIVSGGTTIGTLNSGAANGNTNAVCALCHPDNTAEGKTAKDTDGTGTGKAYPHASDGTNVVNTNASFNTSVITAQSFVNTSTTAANGGNNVSTRTCVNICHFNKSTVMLNDPTWNGAKARIAGGVLGSSTGCEACHNHTGTTAANESATRPLSFAHDIHFANGVTCSGSTDGGCHTVASLHTNYKGVVNLVQLPVLSGTAGLSSAMNYAFANGTSLKYGTANATLSTNGTCLNNCHTTRSPAWSSIPENSTVTVSGCASCHNYPDGNAWASVNAHSVKASLEQTANPTAGSSLRHLNVATAYNKLSDTYVSVTTDVNKCGKCHNNASTLHMNGKKNVTPAATGAASGFKLNTSVTGGYASGSMVTCSNVKCHFNRETPNWY